MRQFKKFYWVIVGIGVLANPSFIHAQDALSLKTATLEEDRETYSLKVEYPELVNLKNQKRQREYNRYVSNLVGGRILSFRRNATNWAQEANKIPPDNTKTSFWLNYRVLNDQSPILSLLFNASTFFAGTPHPSNKFFTVNFDLRRGKNLDLRDIFKKKSAYLQILSEFCQKKLMAEAHGGLNPNLVKQGAGPMPRNYQNFNLTSKGLLIHFEPSQVAPYAMGPQQVLIPFENLQDVLRAKFLKI